MSKINFEEVGIIAVENEPERSPDAEMLSDDSTVDLTVNNGVEEDEEGQGQFEANVFDLVPSIIQAFAAFWRKMWGESDGAELREPEKEGLISLLQRGCEHFGLVKYVSGTFGFFIELLCKLLGITIPRVMKEETRKHFNEEFLQKGKVDEPDTRNRHDESPHDAKPTLYTGKNHEGAYIGQ